MLFVIFLTHVCAKYEILPFRLMNITRKASIRVDFGKQNVYMHICRVKDDIKIIFAVTW